MHGHKPTMIRASVYSGVLHYLKTVKDTGSTEAPSVMDAMERLPADDDAFGKRSVRKDGRALHDFHLFQVKTPVESKGRGTTTRRSPPCLATRRSARSPTAAAHW